MLKKLLVLCLLLMPLAGLSTEVDNVKFEVNKVSDNVYICAQPYGKTYINFGVVLTEQGTLLISSMMNNYAPTIEKLVSSLTDKPIKFVINIDSDPFHHSANQYFAERGANIISHSNIKKAGAYSQLTFDSKLSLEFDSETIHLLHTPARKGDHLLVHLAKNNIIFLGDILRNDWLMYSRDAGLQPHITALNMALEQGNDSTKFVPGNRKSIVYSNADEVRTARDLQSRFTENVMRMLENGQSPEDIAQHSDIHHMLHKLERYEEFSKYIDSHVEDVRQFNKH